MRKMAFALSLAALASVAACRKTGENEFQVETPGEVNVTTDTHTVKTPDVDIVKDTARIVTPDVDIKKDTSKVVVPKVRVKKP